MHIVMIYLVRHGETVFNVAGRHHGWIDCPLTQLGRLQARDAGQVLVGLVGAANAAMFISPLGRAVTTAAIISQEAIFLPSATVDADLREIGMGSAEGLTELEIAQRWPERQRTTQHHMSFEAPDGETLIELGNRLSRALDRIVSSPAAVKVVVSHGVAGRVLQALYLAALCGRPRTWQAPVSGTDRHRQSRPKPFGSSTRLQLFYQHGIERFRRRAVAPRQPTVAVDCADRQDGGIGQPPAASPAQL